MRLAPCAPRVATQLLCVNYVGRSPQQPPIKTSNPSNSVHTGFTWMPSIKLSSLSKKAASSWKRSEVGFETLQCDKPLRVGAIVGWWVVWWVGGGATPPPRLVVGLVLCLSKVGAYPFSPPPHS